ncbi:DUF4352 domain-containing protein [Streptosporangium canum]|uniref:DUF4352 domain-containing protein n=1 Tax=Streptosporangium canum TaxID=324952 RepID=UPI003417B974
MHEDLPPQHGQVQPATAQKKRGGCLRVILVGGAVLAALVVVGVVLGGGDGTSGDSDNTTATDTSTPSGKQKEPKSPRVGDVVKDGKFSFKITKIDKGLTQVGEDFTTSKAQGQYVLVHVTVRNIGDEAQLFDGSAQKLIDSKDRQYDTDSAATLSLKDSNAFLNNINPGNSVSGILLFDVPQDFRIKAIELHDSPFSGGVEIELR